MPQCRQFYQKQLVLKTKENGDDVFVWRFKGVFDQYPLISPTFPLDEQYLALVLDHPSLDKNVLLVPDVDSYKFMNPKILPGINNSVRLLDRFLDKSFFGLTPVRRDVNVCPAERLELIGKKYDLTFNVVTKRDLLGFLIMYLLPSVLALLLLFVNFCMARRRHILTSVSLISGIFIGIIFAHAALRRVLVGPVIFYLETFYVVPYFLIIFVLINLFLFVQNVKIRFITYHDNLLSKILFWPIFLLIMFVITSWMFW